MGIQGLLGILKPYASTSSSSSGYNKTNSNSNNISQFRGMNVAIDTSSWLHKSVYSIADKYVEIVVENQNQLHQQSHAVGGIKRRNNNNSYSNNSNTYMNDKEYMNCVTVSANYIYKRCIELIQYANLNRIYLVMDGIRCPLKVDTNNEREQKRCTNLQQARQFRKSGNTDAMYEKYKSCIKITSIFTQHVITKVMELYDKAHSNNRAANDSNKKKIQIIWSPHEADAQLVQLIQDQRAQFVITEDSDVLVYSAACQISFPIVYKLDRNTGSCDIWNMDWLFVPKLQPTTIAPDNVTTFDDPMNTKRKTKKCDAAGATTKNGNNNALQSLLTALSVRQQREHGLGSRLFVQACILAGCDYAPSTLLNGVGFITALKAVCDTIHRPSDERLQYIVQFQLSKRKKMLKNSNIPSTANTNSADTNLETIIELLMKCEAVFYYHPVRDSNGNIVYLIGNPPPLMYNSNTVVDIPTIDGETALQKSIKDHRPSMERFPQEMWETFLGALDSPHHHAYNSDNKRITLLDQLKEQHKVMNAINRISDNSLHQQRHPHQKLKLIHDSNIGHDNKYISNIQHHKNRSLSTAATNNNIKYKEDDEHYDAIARKFPPMLQQQHPKPPPPTRNPYSKQTKDEQKQQKQSALQASTFQSHSYAHNRSNIDLIAPNSMNNVSSIQQKTTTNHSYTTRSNKNLFEHFSLQQNGPRNGRNKDDESNNNNAAETTNALIPSKNDVTTNFMLAESKKKKRSSISDYYSGSNEDIRYVKRVFRPNNGVNNTTTTTTIKNNTSNCIDTCSLQLHQRQQQNHHEHDSMNEQQKHEQRKENIPPPPTATGITGTSTTCFEIVSFLFFTRNFFVIMYT